MMTASRFPNAPAGIAALPVDRRGYPVPWFVAWVDGEPEFRAIGPGKIERAVDKHLCWVCGRRLGGACTFTLGPMCVINKVAPEPPAHLECARFSARSCPFLSRPLAKRREEGMEDLGSKPPPGIMLKRNPGVVGLWCSFRFGIERERDGMLFRIGPASRPVEWICEGREATRAEVVESIKGGLPNLLAVAEAEGVEAVLALEQQVARAMKFLPADPAADRALRDTVAALPV